MTVWYLIFAIVGMASVTFSTRITPIVLPKRLLESPIFLAVNKGLPLAVMTLLILAGLTWHDHNQNFTLSPLLFAQILALIVVLVSYHYWRQLLISMVIGIASLNGFLWLLDKMYAP